jgi:hypothetical protein
MRRARKLPTWAVIAICAKDEKQAGGGLVMLPLPLIDVS